MCLNLRSICKYSRLSIIRAWFNRFAAQPRQSIFKEKNFIFREYHICLNVLYASMLVHYFLERTVLAFMSSIDILPLFFLKARIQI
jgi:hypothetical protein